MPSGVSLDALASPESYGTFGGPVDDMDESSFPPASISIMIDAGPADAPDRVSAIHEIHRRFDDGFKKRTARIAKEMVPENEVERLLSQEDRLSTLNDNLRDWALEGVSLEEGSTLDDIRLRVGDDRLVCIDAEETDDDSYLAFRNLLVEAYVPAFEALEDSI